MEYINESEAIMLLLFLPTLENHPMVINAPIANILTWCSYDTSKRALINLKNLGFLKYAGKKEGYYQITKKGKDKLKEMKKSYSFTSLSVKERRAYQETY